MKDKKADISKRLMIIRIGKGKSRKDVAAYLGVTVQMITSIESGKSGLTLKNAIALSEFYEMSMDDMFKNPITIEV